MGNFKAHDRNQGPDRRRGPRRVNLLGTPRIESLENRTLLNAGPWSPTSTPGRRTAA